MKWWVALPLALLVFVCNPANGGDDWRGVITWAMDGGPEVAQRAVRLVAEYAFGELGLERLQVEVDPEIHASARVAIRSGFRREGVLRAWDMRQDGVAVDCVAYSRLRTDA